MNLSFLFCIFFFIIVLMILLTILQYEKFTPQIVPEYLYHKTKCFDCEQEIKDSLGEDAVWAAQPSKLFSTEYEGVMQSNGDIRGGFLGKTLKFY